MNQEIRNIYKYNGKDYEFPEELNERFEFLTRKIDFAKLDPDYIELYYGTQMVFECEFKQYESKS